MQIALDKECLVAALNCVSTEKTRFYLNGVSVTYDRGDVNYDATDGHVLFAARREADNIDAAGLQFSIIIPTESVKLALKMSPKFETHIPLLYNAGHWALDKLGFQPIDASFPDVARIAPENTPDAGTQYDAGAIQFNPDLLSRVAKALCGGKANTPRLVVLPDPKHGLACAFGTLDNAYCLIMPLRYDADTKHKMPAWAKWRRIGDATPKTAETPKPKLHAVA